MTESEFIQSIDCNFPYLNPAKWKALVETAVLLSPNAAYMSMHEVSRPPQSCKATQVQLREIADYWIDRFRNPMSERIYGIGLKMIDDIKVPAKEVMELLQEIRKTTHQYNALAIVYFSCNDTEQEIEFLYNEIIQEWRQM